MSKIAESSAEPLSASSDALMALWTEALIGKMLDCIWRGYDRLRKSGIPKQRLDDENWLNQRLAFYLQITVPRRASFVFINQYMEFATRLGRRSTPPTPEIGFVLESQPECAFVAEAKLLHNANHLAKYIGKLRSHFLKGKYSPFCPEGMMLGYLSPRDAEWAFAEIQKKLGVNLETDPRFPQRDHRRSRHHRKLPSGHLRGTFICHHVLMVLGRRLIQGQLL